jgi:ankyrin repeat protein
LLDAAAGPDAVDRRGVSVLSMVILEGHHGKVIELLIGHGADIER